MVGPGKRNVMKTPDWPAMTDKRRLRTMKISGPDMSRPQLPGFSDEFQVEKYERYLRLSKHRLQEIN
ncbi:MAG: hypothetical protein DSY57_03175 [Desulfobulbus sp.]|nr:MAG: hypothetical protein DSY57_03175 [Desulfobulbus sp.]